jgi:hypothetical protein
MNGGTVATDGAGSVPTVTTLQIGDYLSGGNQYLNGWIQHLQYYNTRLSNSALQKVTAP